MKRISIGIGVLFAWSIVATDRRQFLVLLKTRDPRKKGPYKNERWNNKKTLGEQQILKASEGVQAALAMIKCSVIST